MGGEPRGVVGTNSWGSRLYETAVRGSYVDDDVIASTVEVALEHGLEVLDTADDYGLGYAQRLIGSLGATRRLRISAKYTPSHRYRYGQVYEAFDRQCADMGVDHIDYYWLHLPNDIEQNLVEIADLYHRGKIGHIGVSNFNLGEARRAKEFLEANDAPLYGVQNHFSLLDRGEETSGMLAWCHENHLAFWGWAVLEEGVLTGSPSGPMGRMFQAKVRRLGPLFDAMREVGSAHALTVTQVALAYCASKGVVPVCGCRKPYQVEQLARALDVTLSPEEVERLEREADSSGVHILGSDMFRFAVRDATGDRDTVTFRDSLETEMHAIGERLEGVPEEAYALAAGAGAAASVLLYQRGMSQGSNTAKATSLFVGATAAALLASVMARRAIRERTL